MAEEDFEFGGDETSFAGQMSEEEINAFDFNLDKDLKLEGLDNVQETPSLDIASGEETGNIGPQFDLDNLLDNISFDEDETQKQPFFEPQETSFAETDNEEAFTVTADEYVSEVSESEQTPSFINEWEETPKDDGNGDWKAPQSYDVFEEQEVEDEFTVASDEGVAGEPGETLGEFIASEPITPYKEESVFSAEEDIAPVEETSFDVSEQNISAIEEPAVEDYIEQETISEFVDNEANDTEASFENEIVASPIVSETVVERPVATDVHEAGYAKWFSGGADNQYFEIERQTIPYSIEGNDVCQAIHVNCSFDAYGWLVCFENGMTMSLSDVREYQLRNGGLPDGAGIIRYGNNEFPFSGINRIVVYQSVQYFSYGV